MKNTNLPFEQADDSMFDDPIISALIDFIKNHAPKTSVLNPRRYQEMLVSKNALDRLLTENDENASKIHYHPEFLCASVTAEVDSFEVTDMKMFSIAMSTADNFEMYPLTNGKMRIAFTYNRMLVGIDT